MACICAATTSRAQTPQSAAGDERRAGAFTLTPTAYVQLDARTFPRWGTADQDRRMQRDPLELRRVRAGVDGSWRQLRFEFSIDPVDWNEPPIQDAWIEYRLPAVVRVRAGRFKLPGGREYAAPARRSGFLERSPVSESLSAGRDVGGEVEVRVGSRWRWEGGLFAGDGQGRDHRADTTLASRLEWRTARLEVAASGSVGRVSGVPDTDDPTSPNGRATSSYRFVDRVYVQGRRTRVGADAEWRQGGWRASVEVLRLEDQRRQQGAGATNLPPLAGVGVTAGVRWVGDRPMAGVRYDRVTFDDTGPDTGLASVRARASDIRARGSDAVVISGGWRVSRWVRVLGETAIERYDDPRSAPIPDRRGPYVVCGVRLQIELPR